MGIGLYLARWGVSGSAFGSRVETVCIGGGD
jgi:hypothetical protein